MLPQAFRAVIAPLGIVLIALTKNTTVAAAIGVAEAALLMNDMIENEPDKLIVGVPGVRGRLHRADPAHRSGPRLRWPSELAVKR